MKLYCSLVLNIDCVCAEYVGGFEIPPSGGMEPTVRYHAFTIDVLTLSKIQKTVPGGQFNWGGCLKMIFIPLCSQQLREEYQGAFWLYAGNTVP